MWAAVRRFISPLLCVVLLLASINTAYADKILNLRAFSNADKTRVVVDLDFEPNYSSALNNDGRSFVLRVNDVENYKTAPVNLTFEARSVVKKVEKNLSGDDVRYIFTLDGSGQPNVFLLKPMEGQQYRLVADFPHTASSRQPVTNSEVKVLDQKTAAQLKGTGSGSGFPPTHVITIEDADAMESSLFNQLSTVGADGIRTMTPAQVHEYQQKMEQLRDQQEHAMATHAQRQQDKKESKQEEEVLDTPAPPPPQPIKMPVADPYIIAIDAGHGGKDPGAIGKRGVKEKDVTLAIATELAKYVNSDKKFRGKLIRSKDVFVDLDKRSEIARSFKADILISIHADSVASGSSARGASIWVLSTNRAERENNKVLKNTDQGKLLGGISEVLSVTDEQNPYLAATILAMSSDNTRSEGYTLGQEILNKLGTFTKLHKSTPIHASLAVLKSPDIPSLLIETGFLSNKYEEIQLNQPNYQKKIAYYIYQGIVEYYEKYAMQRLTTRYETAIRTGVIKPKIYEVQKGDSLSVIAQRFGVTVDSIKRYNNLTSDNIRIKQKLNIPQ